MNLNPEELAKRIASSFGASIASPIRGTIVINSDGTNPANVDEVGAFYVYVKLLNQPEIVTVEYDPNAISYSVLADGSPVLVQLKESGGYKLIGADMAIVNADPSLYGGPSIYDFQHDHTESTLPLGTNSVTADSITAGAVTNAKLAGTITVALGGTGRATLTANNLLVGAGTGNVTFIAPSTSGNILQSNGTTWASVAPSFNASVITAGTLSVARGGTGLGTLTANNVILGNGTSTPLFVAPGTSGNVLTSNGTTWVSQTPATSGTVTSVGVSSNDLTVGGSPVTTSGTISVDVPDVFAHTESLDNGYWENDSQNGSFDFQSNSAPQFLVSRFKNLFSAKTSVLNADVLGRFVYTGYNSSTQIESSVIRSTATDNFSVGDTPSKLEFLTTADGSSTPALALTLNSDKSAVFAGALSGITSLSASGNISSSAGSVSANTTVSAGTTITAGTGITATTGNISASSGNLSASGSVSASSASITGNVIADIFIADTTVGTNTGGLGYNSTNKALNAYTAGIEQYLGGILFRGTANKSVTTTAVKTSLIPTSGVGTVTLPANFFTAGRMLRYTMRGQVGSLNTTDTLQFDLLLGGTSISLSTARARAVTTTRGFEITGELVCYTTGVSGTITGGATYIEYQPNYVNFVWTPASGVTVNTTGSLAFDITAQWSASSASNSIIAYTFILEAL